MPYALEYSPEARAALAALDPVLQEEVLDEMDRAAEDPLQLPRAGRMRGRLIEFVRNHSGGEFIFFITAEVRRSRLTLAVKAIGWFERPIV